jgi:LysM repeat protein
MFSNKNVRWIIGVAFMIALLATPKPALAMQASGSGYQDGSNCYGYQDSTNCYGSQYPGNCYGYQDGSPCYGYQDGGNGFASYGAPTAGTYVVQRGDTMRIIADRLGVSLTSLIAANPQIWNPNLIYAGQVICLPSFGGQPAYYQQPQIYGAPAYYQQPQSYGAPAYVQQPQSYGPPAYYQPPQNFGPAGYHQDGFGPDYPQHKKSTVNFYTVQKGDTLEFVAHEFGTTVKGLLDLNKDLKKNAPIRVGDILEVH